MKDEFIKKLKRGKACCDSYFKTGECNCIKIDKDEPATARSIMASINAPAAERSWINKRKYNRADIVQIAKEQGYDTVEDFAAEIVKRSGVPLKNGRLDATSKEVIDVFIAWGLKEVK